MSKQQRPATPSPAGPLGGLQPWRDGGSMDSPRRLLAVFQDEAALRAPLVVFVPRSVKKQQDLLLNVYGNSHGPQIAGLVQMMLASNFACREAKFNLTDTHASAMVMQRIAVQHEYDVRGGDMYFLYQLPRDVFMANHVYRLVEAKCPHSTPSEFKQQLTDGIVFILTKGKRGKEMTAPGADEDEDEDEDGKAAGGNVSDGDDSDGSASTATTSPASRSSSSSSSSSSSGPGSVSGADAVPRAAVAMDVDAGSAPGQVPSAADVGRRRARPLGSDSDSSDSPAAGRAPKSGGRSKRKKSRSSTKVKAAQRQRSTIIASVVKVYNEDMGKVRISASCDTMGALLYKTMGMEVRWWTHLSTDTMLPFLTQDDADHWKYLIDITSSFDKFVAAVNVYTCLGPIAGPGSLDRLTDSANVGVSFLDPALEWMSEDSGQDHRFVTMMLPSSILTLDHALVRLRAELLGGVALHESHYTDDAKAVVSDFLDTSLYTTVYEVPPSPLQILNRVPSRQVEVVGPQWAHGRAFFISGASSNQLWRLQDPETPLLVDLTSPEVVELRNRIFAVAHPDVAETIFAQQISSMSSGVIHTDPVAMAGDMLGRSARLQKSTDPARLEKWGALKRFIAQLVRSSLVSNGISYGKSGFLVGQFDQVLSGFDPDTVSGTETFMSEVDRVEAIGSMRIARDYNSRGGRFPSALYYSARSYLFEFNPVFSLVADMMFDCEHHERIDFKHSVVIQLFFLMLDSPRMNYGDEVQHNISVLLTGETSSGKNKSMDVARKFCIDRFAIVETHMSAQVVVSGTSRIGAVFWQEEVPEAALGVDPNARNLLDKILLYSNSSRPCSTTAAACMAKSARTSRVTEAHRATCVDGKIMLVSQPTVRFGTSVGATNAYHGDLSPDLQNRMFDIPVLSETRLITINNRTATEKLGGVQRIGSMTPTLHFMVFCASMLINSGAILKPDATTGNMVISGMASRMTYDYIDLVGNNNRVINNIRMTCFSPTIVNALIDVFCLGIGAPDPMRKWSMDHLLAIEPLLTVEPLVATLMFELNDFIGFRPAAALAGSLRHHVFGVSLAFVHAARDRICRSFVGEDPARHTGARIIIPDEISGSRITSVGGWDTRAEVPAGVDIAVGHAKSFARGAEGAPVVRIPSGSEEKDFVDFATSLVNTEGRFFEVKHFFPLSDTMQTSFKSKIAYLANFINKHPFGQRVPVESCAALICKLRTSVVYLSPTTTEPAIRIDDSSSSLWVHVKFLSLNEVSVAGAAVETIGFRSHTRERPSDETLSRRVDYMRPVTEGSAMAAAKNGSSTWFDEATRYAGPNVVKVQYVRLRHDGVDSASSSASAAAAPSVPAPIPATPVPSNYSLAKGVDQLCKEIFKKSNEPSRPTKTAAYINEDLYTVRALLRVREHDPRLWVGSNARSAFRWVQEIHRLADELSTHRIGADQDVSGRIDAGMLAYRERLKFFGIAFGGIISHSSMAAAVMANLPPALPNAHFTSLGSIKNMSDSIIASGILLAVFGFPTHAALAEGLCGAYQAFMTGTSPERIERLTGAFGALNIAAGAPSPAAADLHRVVTVATSSAGITPQTFVNPRAAVAGEDRRNMVYNNKYRDGAADAPQTVDFQYDHFTTCRKGRLAVLGLDSTHFAVPANLEQCRVAVGARTTAGLRLWDEWRNADAGKLRRLCADWTHALSNENDVKARFGALGPDAADGSGSNSGVKVMSRGHVAEALWRIGVRDTDSVVSLTKLFNMGHRDSFVGFLVARLARHQHGADM